MMFKQMKEGGGGATHVTVFLQREEKHSKNSKTLCFGGQSIIRGFSLFAGRLGT
jgi:hypothetical protein